LVQDVTARIQERSAKTRKAYLADCEANIRPGPRRKRLTEGNVAHASAACPVLEKTELLGAKWANIGIVTAYNDMLSAHQPFETPQIFAPAGPMPSGITNPEKARVRQLFAEGKVGRKELLAAESASYHAPGTCTFYKTLRLLVTSLMRKRL